MAAWDDSDTREVGKGVLIALIVVAGTKLLEWGIDIARRTHENAKARPDEAPDPGEMP